MFLQMFALLLCALPSLTNGFATDGSTSLLTSLSTNGSTSGSTSGPTSGPTSGSTGPSTNTYQRTDPESGVVLTCDRCAPGTYLHAPCTATRKSACAACPPGSFTELWNYIEACIPCGACGVNQEVRAQCSAALNTACRCTAGHYHAPEYEMCVRHSACPAGSGVVAKGTPAADTVCQPCAAGSFSAGVSALDGCLAHSPSPEGRGLLLLPGEAWHDCVWTNCKELRQRDALDYLRDLQQDFPEAARRGLLLGPLPPPEEQLGPQERRGLLLLPEEQLGPQERRGLLLLRRGSDGHRLRHRLRKRRKRMLVQCGKE